MKTNNKRTELLIHLKNGMLAGKKYILCVNTSSNRTVLNLLIETGFLRKYTLCSKNKLKVFLKYIEGTKSLIHKIVLISKPSKPFFVTCTSLWKINVGLGIFFIHTTSGLLPHPLAKQKNLGGEVICFIE
jgi:small subunit ribosomal protein S8